MHRKPNGIFISDYCCIYYSDDENACYCPTEWLTTPLLRGVVGNGGGVICQNAKNSKTVLNRALKSTVIYSQ